MKKYLITLLWIIFVPVFADVCPDILGYNVIGGSSFAVQGFVTGKNVTLGYSGSITTINWYYSGSGPVDCMTAIYGDNVGVPTSAPLVSSASQTFSSGIPGFLPVTFSSPFLSGVGKVYWFCFQALASGNNTYDAGTTAKYCQQGGVSYGVWPDLSTRVIGNLVLSIFSNQCDFPGLLPGGWF